MNKKMLTLNKLSEKSIFIFPLYFSTVLLTFANPIPCYFEDGFEDKKPFVFGFISM